MEKYCTKCGNKFNENDKYCTKCGYNPDVPDNSTSKQVMSNDGVRNNLICPKCHNQNVTFQVVNETQLVTKHHGIIWWLCIGWWWIFFKWLVLTIPALFTAIFIGKRKKIKNITKKVKVCQNCGHTW